MPPHAIGSGTVSFGLVTIPVKVYSASQTSESISFNLLHKDCGSRLKQQYICLKDEEIVDRADMVKGYEFSKGQYVLFSEQELKDLEEKSTQAIEITEFVPSEAIDPIFFDKAYYLGPDRHGTKAYSLLAKAMEGSRRWAVAKYIARGRQYLVVLRPHDGGLVMQQLHYPNEIKRFSELSVETTDVNDKELQLAMLLADQVTSESFNPAEYHDEARERLKALIQRKVEGEEVSFAPQQEPKGEVIDLMAALKASLAGGSAREKAPSRGTSRPAERKPAQRAARRVEAPKTPRRKASK
ncbi:MAG TPA: Ku protein [Thermoanaerobaculia bacterium]|nr:Ku protein [Thermoanaerobaculia bacterium]